jgi:hypothetical protein
MKRKEKKTKEKKRKEKKRKEKIGLSMIMLHLLIVGTRQVTRRILYIPCTANELLVN